MPQKLILLWQTTNSALSDWIREIFAPVIEREVTDGEHKVVLDNCLIVDTHLHRRPAEYYREFRGRNAFLIREPDEHFRDISGIYTNFCGVFRMHYSAAFRRERVMPVPLGYVRGLAGGQAHKPASERKYAWAMLGQMNKSTRPDALTAMLRAEPNFWYASDGWTPGAATAATNAHLLKGPETYRELLAESAFSPAPMGNIQQETNRPFEALEAGSIPLLEKRWLMDVHRGLLGKHPLPTFSSWTEASRFVQKMWLDKPALDALQRTCVAWWKDYKVHLSGEIERFVERLWNAQPGGNDEYVRSYAHLPGWAIWEVLRHHSLGAMRRRVVRQARRVLERGRLFERI